jgi:acetyl-CoA carboxylase carboxyltransferase component
MCSTASRSICGTCRPTTPSFSGSPTRSSRSSTPKTVHPGAFNQKQIYDFDEVLARLVDGSEHMEFKPGYGPEIYTGLVKMDGFLVGVIGNRQGWLGENYPEYADYPGIGGKLYRQGLIKMNEFVTLCGRDRVPIIWFQDTSGIDVGDIAEKAELLGLGQSLIYSIQQTDVPMMLVVLRKGTAAAHYVMGGPTANRHTAFTLGTATTEIYVMHGETAAAASFSRRLVKKKRMGVRSSRLSKNESDGQGVLRQFAPHLLRPERHGGRDRPDDRAAQVYAGLCRRGLPEPQVDLPAPPDAPAARNQGVGR